MSKTRDFHIIGTYKFCLDIADFFRGKKIPNLFCTVGDIDILQGVICISFGLYQLNETHEPLLQLCLILTYL